MGVEAEELLLRPLHDVIERANDAVRTASAAAADHVDVAEDMSKAAQALFKEGDRALKRLGPLWDRQVDKYGDSFRDAILQQGT